jgi:hypothetical protein
MGRLRQGSRARRAAIGVAALYALLLHALLAALAPAASFAFPGGIETYNCSQDGTGSDGPGGHSSHHHGLCCILICACAACPYVGTASPAGVFGSVAEGARFVFAPLQIRAARPPVKFFFAARGPPQEG